jgi:hypothetical protein
MYVVTRRGYGQVDELPEEYPIATTVAATSQSGGQAVGLVLAFFSTLMFFTSIMMQGNR